MPTKEHTVSTYLTAEEIVRVNSHELTAHLLVSAYADIKGLRAQYDADRRRMLGTIDRAGRIGLRALVAKDRGRKTMRLDDLIGDDQ